jgi:hypothetical protein
VSPSERPRRPLRGNGQAADDKAPSDGELTSGDTVEVVRDGVAIPRVRSPSRVESSTRTVTRGGLLLFLKDGRLHDLEVMSFGDPLPLPEASSVRWWTPRS